MEFARAAEEAGFDGIGFTDHPAPTHRWLAAGGHDALDPFAALAFAAAVTERLLLIPNVVVLPYRNPFLVAKSAATIDALSGGRFVLAVGYRIPQGASTGPSGWTSTDATTSSTRPSRSCGGSGPPTTSATTD